MSLSVFQRLSTVPASAFLPIARFNDAALSMPTTQPPSAVAHQAKLRQRYGTDSSAWGPHVRRFSASSGSSLSGATSLRAAYNGDAPTAPEDASVQQQTASNGAVEAVEDGAVTVCDDLDQLIECLPASIRAKLLNHPRRAELLEVVLDLGRRPEARFLGHGGAEYLQDEEVTRLDLDSARLSIGEFGGDNRAGVEGTLHRISAIRNRRGDVVGLTCRVGRAVTGHVDMIRDLLHHGQSLLFLGRPGVGKTTVIREIARVLSDDLHLRVVIVDTSNEIGGDGDVPHAAIGGARRMQVPDPTQQHRVMVEAVENHMPQVVIVDEIGTEAEALACRSIAERGVMLVGTAHGQLLENLIKNPTLCDLVGGVQTVTLGDEEARARGTQKSVLERTAPPTFPVLIEMRERHFWVAHQTDKSVDALLHGKRPQVEVRTRGANSQVAVERRMYDRNGSSCSAGSSSSSSSGMGGDEYWMAGSDDEFDWGARSSSSSGGSSAGGSAAAAASRFEISYGRNVSGGSSSGNSNGSSNGSSSGSSSVSKGATGELAVEQTYSWAAKLGYVPDKDAMMEASADGGSSSSSSSSSSRRTPSPSTYSWSDFDEDFYLADRPSGGYSGAAASGKRGSKRGPRGIRTR